MMATAHKAAASRGGDGLPSHHLDDAFLLDYAAGNTSEAVSLLIATHLALCPECRARAEELEALGGAMLESLAPTAVDHDALSAVLARLDASDEVEPSVLAPPANDEGQVPSIPMPLRGYLNAEPDALTWQPVIRGLEEYELDAGGAKTKLLRIKPGASMPQHTHEGRELTLVLEGSYDDEIGHFGRGDVAILDDDHDHRPIAGPGQDCICLTVIDAPLRLTGRFGRFLNPFVKF